jgi:hypothetical protein
VRRVLLTAVAVAVPVVVVLVVFVGGRADAVRGILGPSQAAQLAEPLPEVRDAARSIERLDVGGGRALLARSPLPSNRVAIVAHGRGSLAGTIFARQERAAWSIGLLRNGYSVATADAGGDAWGNDASVADYRRLAARLRAKGLDQVVIVGTSMGGLASLQLLRELRPLAYVGIYPVYDLGSIFRRGRFADSIRRAYGFRGDRLPAEALQRSPVALPPLRGLPVIVEASPRDTVVPKVDNADMLAYAARIAGAQVTEIETKGEHGDPSNWDAGKLIPLLDRAAGLPTVTSARRGAPSRPGRS